MKIATNFRSANVPHTKREALADDEKKRERTKDAKKKTNARTTNFHPGYVFVHMYANSCIYTRFFAMLLAVFV